MPNKNNIIKKDETPKKDIGNLNNDVFKCELDPDNKLKLVEDKEKGQKAYYKGKPMKYMDYIAEVGDRVKRNKEGKGVDKIGLFGGVSFDENGKIIKS
jgi:hypothetical protein|tara:strand:- start:349 stop:642 length:294 start_codon:yes stop_codon:yes gene_type:complete